MTNKIRIYEVEGFPGDRFPSYTLHNRWGDCIGNITAQGPIHNHFLIEDTLHGGAGILRIVHTEDEAIPQIYKATSEKALQYAGKEGEVVFEAFKPDKFTDQPYWKKNKQSALLTATHFEEFGPFLRKQMLSGKA
tara:strand:+ start:2463 stop:2867 length:405 start_codon:yes stop_codon:yes gene_type:complete